MACRGLVFLRSVLSLQHNSYYRYLGRLKAKKPIRQGKIPSNYGAPIKFNCAFPIKGAKTIKTSIVSGCNNCELINEKERKIYQIYNIENKLKTTISSHEKVPSRTDNLKCLKYCEQKAEIDKIKGVVDLGMEINYDEL